MTALHRTGRRAEALEAYHTVREYLAEELGIDPGEELRQQLVLVLSGASPAGISPFRWLATQETLPVQPTPQPDSSYLTAAPSTRPVAHVKQV
jgi:hypothetical protein